MEKKRWRRNHPRGRTRIEALWSRTRRHPVAPRRIGTGGRRQPPTWWSCSGIPVKSSRTSR